MSADGMVGQRALFMGTIVRVERGTYVVRSEEGLLFAFGVADPGLAGRSWGTGERVAVLGTLRGLTEQITPEGALARMITVDATAVVSL